MRNRNASSSDTLCACVSSMCASGLEASRFCLTITMHSDCGSHHMHSEKLFFAQGSTGIGGPWLRCAASQDQCPSHCSSATTTIRLDTSFRTAHITSLHT
ncbi:unnamed protein product [Mycena citricolor]|uniref:Uncharacterized protein n=1 Tax=Mycena citricolor TaxID=2018698 RepID=A0AAD2GSJ4_9AGAR|nr:unnamed protein product [Mycena citricolor]